MNNGTVGPSFDLTGKVALVTGGARGLGYQIALALAAYGADVAVCDLKLCDMEKVCLAIRETGRRAFAVETDLTKVPQIHTMVQKVMDEFGRIDILVNNAGMNIQQFAIDVTEEAWDKVLNINLKAVFFCSQAVGKIMIGQKSGKIINVSSQMGTVAMPRRAAYCSSKGGVNLMTKLLAVEWAQYGINVNAIAPTFIKTPLTEPMFKDEDFCKWVYGHIPLGRVGTPTDITGAVVYLASPASDLVTGDVLHIDGGWTAH